MSKLIQLAFHLSSLVVYTYAVYVIPFLRGHSDTYGGGMKYFTRWNHYLCIGYFLYSFVDDLMQTSQARFIADRKRSFVFNSLVFPCTMITCSVFWIIYAIEPDMMVPLAVREIVPIDGFYNNAVHTFPLATTVIESLFISHKPDTLKKTLLLWTFYAASYVIWILWVAFKANIWVYPFLRAFNSSGRALFLLGIWVLGCFLVKIQHSFLTSINANKAKQSKNKSKNMNKKRI